MTAFQYVGYLTGVDKKEDEGSDDEEEQDSSAVIENLDFGKRSKRVKIREAIFTPFTDAGLGPAFNVTGKFHFTNPWWKVKFNLSKNKDTVKKRRSVLVDGYFSYALRNDRYTAGQGLVSLMLTECGMTRNEHGQRVMSDGIQNGIAAFFAFLRSCGLEKSLTFENVMDRIGQMAESGLSEQQKCEAQLLQSHLSRSMPFVYVQVALAYPNIPQYLPRLLPTKFYMIMCQLGRDEDSLKKLSDMIAETPWELGFYKLFMAKTGFPAEADIKPLIETKLFDRIEPLYQDALVVYSTLKYANLNEGHTYLTKQQIRQHKSLERVFIRPYRHIRDVVAALDWMVKVKIVVREEWYGEERITLTRWYNYEKTIADCFVRLMGKHKENPLRFEVDLERTEFDNIRRDPDQMKAVHAICREPVVVMSGKGGCGKTATVSVVLNYVKGSCVLEERERADLDPAGMDDSKHAALAQAMGLKKKEQKNAEPRPTPQVAAQNPDSFVDVWDSLCQEEGAENDDETDNVDPDKEPLILLGAPTGKAASVLRKRAKLNAQTLHHVFMTYDVDMAKDGPEPPKWRYRRVRVLVVDEGSMVPISVFSKVFKLLLDEAKLEKIVVLGDVLQLPSIEAGFFLGDIFKCFEKHGLSLSLRTCHRASSILIVENAVRVSHGEMPVFDDERLFHFVKFQEPEGGAIMAGPAKNGQWNKNDDLEWRIDQTLRRLIEGEPSLKDHHNNHFITFTRKRVTQLNEICCRHYNGHTLVDDKRRLQFVANDKIVVTKNSEVKVMKLNASNEYSSEDLKLYNGEIFFLKHPEVLCPRVGFDMAIYSPGCETYVVNTDQLRKASEIQHGWVTTIHKFQGSEAETILYVVHGGRFETWQHVYTAITRAQKRVFIVGTQRELEAALQNSPVRRQTNLKEFLQSQLVEIMNDDSSKIDESDIAMNETSQYRDAEFENVLDGLQDQFSDSDLDDLEGWTTPLKKAPPPVEKDVKYMGESIVDDDSCANESNVVQIDLVESPPKVEKLKPRGLSFGTPLLDGGANFCNVTPIRPLNGARKYDTKLAASTPLPDKSTAGPPTQIAQKMSQLFEEDETVEADEESNADSAEMFASTVDNSEDMFADAEELMDNDDGRRGVKRSWEN